ncbi:uncharacterized protein C3orf26 homolog [Babylonia areolata]|uniref:uncharacterized protein C3orf26 homolog n=1 Tax=Babylonia areolata TaxID=304850 RepID=UPI003FD27C8D
MADDLGDEWWKESDDNAENLAEEDSGDDRSLKRGIKRPADSDDEDDLSDEPPQKTPTKKSKTALAEKKKSKPAATKENAGKKKKKKKSQKTFTRKKITDVDEDILKKAGTPSDVQALIRPVITISKSDGSHSESDDVDDDDATLSVDTDFFPANQHQSAADYLKEVLPGWQVAVEKAKLSPGSPLLLVLCSSAIRAVQLNRELKSFLGKDCKTAKLFAKHMKLEEQKTFLEKKVCHASIGTPNRVQALLESGSLKLDHVHAVVLDWNWRDIKLKRMVDVPDVRRDLTLLLKEHAVQHVTNTPCRVALL